MKFVVTGAAGFIGSTLVEKLLSLGHEVTGIDNFDDFYSKEIKQSNLAKSLMNKRFTFQEIDILDLEKLRLLFPEEYDLTIHLAARAGVRPSLENPLLYQQVNVGGTQNIITISTEKKIRKIVFASSSSVYGTNDNLPWREDDLDLRPISPYASSKISGEWLGKCLTNMTDIDFISLRFFTVYGPRQRPDLAINSFFRKIRNGEALTVFGDGSSIRDYTYVDDIVEGVTAAAINYQKAGYDVFNLGSNNPIRLLDMIHTIEEILGKKATLAFTGNQTGDAPKTFANTKKAREAFGFEPTTTFNEGLRKYLASLN